MKQLIAMLVASASRSSWQRMYTLASDAGTGQYLKNIVMYLSLVGCKAAPIRQPH